MTSVLRAMSCMGSIRRRLFYGSWRDSFTVQSLRGGWRRRFRGGRISRVVCWEGRWRVGGRAAADDYSGEQDIEETALVEHGMNSFVKLIHSRKTLRVYETLRMKQKIKEERNVARL